MEIEIWSDIMCPFCYIGKRRLEMALEQFDPKEEIKITWKSFLLNPELKTDPSKNSMEYLAEEKGMSLEEVKQLFSQVNEMAREVGLDYSLEKTIVANSLNAHRFLHFALSKGKQLEAKELLFHSHFIKQKNVDDLETLLEIGQRLELNPDEVKAMFESSVYEDAVKFDLYEAHQLGVKSVPFFVFNNAYGIPGAQPLEVFTRTLEQASQQ
jgi:predicted DsbA family dithiol-disulfide isomerase